MKTNLIVLIVVLLTTSCSSTWHLKRATKKNPDIVSTPFVKDTIINVLEKDSGSVVVTKDSTFKIGVVTVNLTKDSITNKVVIKWFSDEVTKTVPLKSYVIKPIPTRLEKKQAFKLEKIKLRTQAKVKKAEAKSKTVKRGKPFINLAIMIIVALIVVLFYVNKKDGNTTNAPGL